MRICIIADQIYKSGGIERVLSYRINHWINIGHEVSLITHENKGNSSYFDFNSNLEHFDLEGSFNKKISLFAPINIRLAALYFFKFKKVFYDINPDVVIVANYSYEFYFIPLIKSSRYAIKEYHSSFSKGKGVAGYIRKIASKFYDKHVFLSNEEQDLSCVDNSVVIPNPITNKDTLPSRLADREKVILAAGRIVTIKGFERLIDSWSRIAKIYPDWRLEIYGDGEPSYTELLNTFIFQKDIAENTKIFPSTPHITNRMLNARIYAMTSLTECFPMVLLEAMQSKMAVIAFDCPTGPRNIIKHQKTGILVSDNDIDDFTLQLESLIKSNTLGQKLSDNAYDDVQQYNIDITMKKWDRLIQKRFEK